MSIKEFFRVAPGLSIIVIFLAVFWSPLYVLLPPDFQLFMVKLFLPVMGVIFAHWIGKAFFPTVENWNNYAQPYIKAARIALYVTIPLSTALGG
ncbi:MAG: hypothetical protein KAV87_07930 [Desulfobacteraceae bacterium]|nr:hypothetical protein [Desulfobacteraceae bacterium]